MLWKKNIKGAAHGSSGASELKTCKAWILTSAKKAISTLSHLSAIFLPLSLFAVDEQFFTTNQACVLQLGHFEGTSLVTTDIKTTFSDLPSRLFRNSCGLYFKKDGTLQIPNLANVALVTTATNLSYSTRPVSVDGVAYPWKYFPTIEQFFVLAEVAFSSGLREPVFEYQADRYYNISFANLFQEILFGTNTSFRSSLLNRLTNVGLSLDNIYGDLLSIVSNSDDSLSYLRSLANNYSAANSTALVSFNDFLQGAVSAGSFSQSEAESYQRRYDSLSGSARDYYAQTIRDLDSTARNLADTLSRVSANEEDVKDLGRVLNDSLDQSMNQGFSQSAHIAGATRDSMQRMTNLTEQIKEDLQEWRTDATNRLEQQWEGIKKNKENTDAIKDATESIAANGVKVQGPISVHLDNEFPAITIDDPTINKIQSAMSSGSEHSIDKWINQWVNFTSVQAEYQRDFSQTISDSASSLLSIDNKLSSVVSNITDDLTFTNTLDDIYQELTNGLGVAAVVTNENWNYYFDKFKQADESKDFDDSSFSLEYMRKMVFGNGFDEGEYHKLNWFSRVELLLYQIGYSSTNGEELVQTDLEGEFDDVSSEIETAASAFQGAASKVVDIFSLINRFANTVKNAFSEIASPNTGGIYLLEGGSWIVDEPLVLNVPVVVQNSLRLVFQSIWYLAAFVVGWRLVLFAWGSVASLVRWLWSLIDV